MLSVSAALRPAASWCLAAGTPQVARVACRDCARARLSLAVLPRTWLGFRLLSSANDDGSNQWGPPSTATDAERAVRMVQQAHEEEQAAARRPGAARKVVRVLSSADVATKNVWAGPVAHWGHGKGQGQRSPQGKPRGKGAKARQPPQAIALARARAQDNERMASGHRLIVRDHALSPSVCACVHA